MAVKMQKLLDTCHLGRAEHRNPLPPCPDPFFHWPVVDPFPFEGGLGMRLIPRKEKCPAGPQNVQWPGRLVTMMQPNAVCFV